MHADTSATTQQHWGTGGLTVKQYAEAKKLPVDFLLKLGITDITYMSQPAVRIPYFGLEGEEMAVRFRTALKGRNRFRWRKGTKPCLYGLWQLADWGSDYIILVEGESDCHTLWVNDFPALGLPGAGIWNESRDGPYLDGYKTIYVVIEPDKGGETVISWLKKSSIRTRAKLVNLADLKI